MEAPREKLIKYGSEQLTDQELLAILLRTGGNDMSVQELSARLLSWFGGLDKLLNASYERLHKIKGLGVAKITQLLVVLEIYRRVLNQKLDKGVSLTSTEVTRERLKLHYQGMEREAFACLFLDTQHRLLSLENLFYGTVDSAAVYPREIVKRALSLNASAVILAHNHPSGSPEPSEADIRITNVIKEALNLIDIRVLDHMIIGAGRVLSFAERQLL
ncbi:MAG: DNA repair protein RadC [Endozoicomonas sp. (ex Botrylloides leachii)]|nr:DNA repair protein RadC [Endozoicomonas sp. (ex Botrylloides leachii)]